MSSTPSSCATRGSSSTGYWATYRVRGGPKLVDSEQSRYGRVQYGRMDVGSSLLPDGHLHVHTTQFQVNGWEVSDSYTGGRIGDDPPYYLDLLPNVTGVFNDIAGIEVNAIASGQVYWNYLRALGYTNPAQIPAKFRILPPAETMPPTMCIDNVSIYGGTGYNGACLNLNYTELNSLYLAWLASLAHFFNSTTYQKGPSPCSSAGNCTSWGNLNEYGRGSVYVPVRRAHRSHRGVRERLDVERDRLSASVLPRDRSRVNPRRSGLGGPVERTSRGLRGPGRGTPEPHRERDGGRRGRR